MINYIYRVLKLHDFDDIEFTTGLGVNICFCSWKTYKYIKYHCMCCAAADFVWCCVWMQAEDSVVISNVMVNQASDWRQVLDPAGKAIVNELEQFINTTNSISSRALVTAQKKGEHRQHQHQALSSASGAREMPSSLISLPHLGISDEGERSCDADAKKPDHEEPEAPQSPRTMNTEEDAEYKEKVMEELGRLLSASVSAAKVSTQDEELERLLAASVSAAKVATQDAISTQMRRHGMHEGQDHEVEAFAQQCTGNADLTMGEDIGLHLHVSRTKNDQTAHIAQTVPKAKSKVESESKFKVKKIETIDPTQSNNTTLGKVASCLEEGLRFTDYYLSVVEQMKPHELPDGYENGLELLADRMNDSCETDSSSFSGIEAPHCSKLMIHHKLEEKLSRKIARPRLTHVVEWNSSCQKEIMAMLDSEGDESCCVYGDICGFFRDELTVKGGLIDQLKRAPALAIDTLAPLLEAGKLVKLSNFCLRHQTLGVYLVSSMFGFCCATSVLSKVLKYRKGIWFSSPLRTSLLIQHVM